MPSPTRPSSFECGALNSPPHPSSVTRWAAVADVEVGPLQQALGELALSTPEAIAAAILGNRDNRQATHRVAVVPTPVAEVPEEVETLDLFG